MNVTRYKHARPSLFNMFFDDVMTREKVEGAACAPASEYKVRPAANISENDKGFEIEMTVPGFDKKDIQVEINDKVLKVSAEVESLNESDEKNYRRKEFSRRSFSRSFRLSDDIDQENIDAKYKNGMLTVSLPKDEKARLERVRQIKVG